MRQEDIDSHDKFLFTLEWLLAVTKRYSDPLQFGLVHIHYKNLGILGETYGAKNASHKLDDVSRSLRKAFRKTDLVARDGTDFWILVPYTQANEKLVDKVNDTIEAASQDDLHVAEHDISIFALSQDVVNVCEGCSASEFLLYIKINRTGLALHKKLWPQ
jgi:predicted signal transduction protein with EAL and GGDEF domain